LFASLAKAVRVEVHVALTMKNAIFWSIVLCRYSVNRRFGITYTAFFIILYILLPLSFYEKSEIVVTRDGETNAGTVDS
jgi:hypothetical protein